MRRSRLMVPSITDRARATIVGVRGTMFGSAGLTVSTTYQQTAFVPLDTTAAIAPSKRLDHLVVAHESSLRPIGSLIPGFGLSPFWLYLLPYRLKRRGKCNDSYASLRRSHLP
jgi:hypothetical protein